MNRQEEIERIMCLIRESIGNALDAAYQEGQRQRAEDQQERAVVEQARYTNKYIASYGSTMNIYKNGYPIARATTEDNAAFIAKALNAYREEDNKD